MIERQRGDDDLLALLNRFAGPCTRLQYVRNEVAVGQDCAFRRSGCAAGVLEQGGVAMTGLRLIENGARAAAQRTEEANGARNVPRRHHLLHPLHREVDQPPARRLQQIANLCGHHVADIGAGDHILEHVGEVLDNHNRFRAGVLQLVLQFARGVQRVHVHHDHARAQHAKECDRDTAAGSAS